MKARPRPYTYDTFEVLFFCVFIGFLRLFMEWALGGTYILFPPSDLAMAFGYYWLEAFVLAWVLQLVLGTPWRSVVPLALLGVGLDLVPPVLDRLTIDGSFQYGYLWDFPQGFRWLLYSPEANFTLGEAVAWWLLIACLAGYVGFRTRSGLRTLAAAVLAYGAALFLMALIPAAAAAARLRLAWPAGHQRTVFVLLLALAVLAVYGALAPGLVRGLVRRIHHAFPFVAFCFVGSAFAGGIVASTFIYATLLLLMFAAALAQNDLYDAAEDERQGRERYLDREDVRFLTVSLGFVVAILAGVGTLATVPLLVVLVISMLYSFPFYRGKRFFPSNLKMEGMWGLSSFTLGVVAAIEHEAYGAPSWWLASLPKPADAAALGPFGGMTLAAMVLAFGGYSLVAVLKDYKDWEADEATGVQTVYTLAARKGLPLSRVHAVAVGCSSAALAAAPILLAFGGLAPWGYAAGGPVAAAVLWRLMSGAPSGRAFTATLYLLTVYFLFLAIALSA